MSKTTLETCRAHLPKLSRGSDAHAFLTLARRNRHLAPAGDSR